MSEGMRNEYRSETPFKFTSKDTIFVKGKGNQDKIEIGIRKRIGGFNHLQMDHIFYPFQR